MKKGSKEARNQERKKERKTGRVFVDIEESREVAEGAGKKESNKERQERDRREKEGMVVLVWMM